MAHQKDTKNYFAVKFLKKDVMLVDNDDECKLIKLKVPSRAGPLIINTNKPYLNYGQKKTLSR